MQTHGISWGRIEFYLVIPDHYFVIGTVIRPYVITKCM